MRACLTREKTALLQVSLFVTCFIIFVSFLYLHLADICLFSVNE